MSTKARNHHPLQDLDEDIRLHIEIETQDNIAKGMPPEEAHYAAVRKFGNITKIKEETHEIWNPIWLEQFLQDIRYGLRILKKKSRLHRHRSSHPGVRHRRKHRHLQRSLRCPAKAASLSASNATFHHLPNRSGRRRQIHRHVVSESHRSPPAKFRLHRNRRHAATSTHANRPRRAYGGQRLRRHSRTIRGIRSKASGRPHFLFRGRKTRRHSRNNPQRKSLARPVQR